MKTLECAAILPETAPGRAHLRASRLTMAQDRLNVQSKEGWVMRGSHELVKEPGQEEGRRGFLVETTIDALADFGYVGTTLARIAERAGVSAGLVAHYFGDKDGLLFATFRTVAAQLRSMVLARLREAHTPRERIMALIDANLGPGE